MDFYLSKIEPHLVKSVNQKTSDYVVHAKEEIQINKDAKQKQKEEQNQNHENITEEEMKKKIEELNENAATFKLNIYFKADLENELLVVKVYDKATDRYLRTYKKTVISKILEGMKKASGGLVDEKG